ncbi:translation initiation factor IF-2 [uncultured Selenomonas sp.]|uniref:translation initiation factor IF-2 n=1 Tax=uncultured Selenomonas sp. TaxID=159275 RepID=UPI0028F09E57|nr:translation initiation factor IF-2 [uncultured Selenomonas sp.]
MSNGHYRAVAMLCITGGILPMPAAAQAAAPWVYDAVEELADDGYIDLGERDASTLSEKELTELVAQGLHEIDRIQQGTLADEYGRVTALMVRDEMHVKLYREQEQITRRNYDQAMRTSRHAEEMLARQSMRGVNRLEVMRPLQARAEAARTQLTSAARDYALTQMRREKRELAYEKLKERQSRLLTRLTAVDSEGGREDVPLVRPQVMDAAARLRAEFIENLAASGYTDRENAEQQLYAPVLLPDVPEKRLKIDGQVRLDTRHSTGKESSKDRTRIRARIYPDYNIDGNWHAVGMIEAEKTIAGDSSDKDGQLKFDRWYLMGRSGVTDVMVGQYGSTMAEGNVYDSKFRGIRLSAGVPITYTFEHGKIDRARKVTGLTASYQTAVDTTEAGVYRFDKIGSAVRTIYMGNYRRPLGIFDFGAMVLHGRDHAAGNGTGYVFTLERPGAGAWRPGSYSYWLKYYRQPSATYVSHTMNGMADYMNYDASGNGPLRGGFRGWGAGWSYTLKKNLLFSLEYYDLQDLTTRERSRTIWGALTGYFKNYDE